ncbi:hypothetical protein [Pyramidobacter porci]
MKKFMTAVLLLCLCSVQSFAMTLERHDLCNEIIETYRPSWIQRLSPIPLSVFSSSEKAAGEMASKIGQVFDYWAISADYENIGVALLKECPEWQECAKRHRRVLSSSVLCIGLPQMLELERCQLLCKIAWDFAYALDTGNFTVFPAVKKYFIKLI